MENPKENDMDAWRTCTETSHRQCFLTRSAFCHTLHNHCSICGDLYSMYSNSKTLFFSMLFICHYVVSVVILYLLAL